MLNYNHLTKERNAPMTSKQDSRSSLPFNNKDTQTEIIMAEKRDTNSISHRQQPEMTGVANLSVCQKVAPTNLDTPEGQIKGEYSLQHCSTATELPGIPPCLPLLTPF